MERLREAYGTCGCSLQNKLELGNGTAIIAAPPTTTGQAEKDEPRATESTHNRERKNVSGIESGFVQTVLDGSR